MRENRTGGPAAIGQAVPASWIARLNALAARGGRRILGIAGPPGAGKSTLAQALSGPSGAIVVPLDGFHLANAELARLGRADRKGAPDTFDAAGFLALLRRLRDPVAGEVVYAPQFQRDIEEAVAGAIAVPADATLIVVEGNYLLIDARPWRAIRPLLDECWFVAVDPAKRRERLIARHIAFGRDRKAAEAWVASTDDPNATLVEESRERADFIADLEIRS